MNLSVTIFVVFISICVINASLLEPVIENVVHIKASASHPNGAPGTWKKKTVWKPRWVKEWKSAKVMKPTYKKVWSPVLIKEWIPFPKPPPEWDNKSTPLKPVASESTGPMPLWDPMPYPESQQPPPAGPSTPPLPPFPIGPGGPGSLGNHRGPNDHHGISDVGFPGTYSASDSAPVGPFFKGKPHCHHAGCNSPALTFTQEQISQIIGHNRYKKETEHAENGKFPEPAPDSPTQQPVPQNWRSRRQSSLAFNLLQGLSQFLLPPKIPGFNYQSKPAEPHQPPKRTNSHSQNSRPPNHVQHNGFRQAQPIPAQNKRPSPPNRHHHSSPLQQSTNLKKPNSQSQNSVSNPNGFHKNAHPNHQGQPPKNPNLIQPAELVSEYHYSEFDIMHPTKPPQPVDHLKFKPLPPSMWTLPSATASTLYENQQPQGGPVLAKPRPIRKHPEQHPDRLHNSHQTVTPAPPPPFQLATTATFEQEKAITKEIVPINMTPIPLPVNHKHDSEPNYKEREKENPTNEIDSPLGSKLEGSQNGISNKPMKEPIRLSEEALLNAIQNNRTATHRTTTPWYQSNTSYLSDNSEVTSTTTTAKSPVYIVTPIYQSQTN